MRALSFVLIALLCLAVGVEVSAQKAGKGQPPAQKNPAPPKPPPEIKEWGGKTLDQWIALIPTRDRSVSSAALKVLLDFPRAKAKKAVPIILEELHKHKPPQKSLDLAVRTVGPAVLATILVSLEKPTKAEVKQIQETIDLLTSMLKDDQVIVRMRAAESLMMFGPNAKGAIDSLIKMAEYIPSYEVRLTGTKALGFAAWDKENDPPKKVLKTLYGHLITQHGGKIPWGDSASTVRLQTIESLANLGAPIKKSLRGEFEDNFAGYVAQEPEPMVKLTGYCYLYRATTDAAKKKRRLTGISAYADKTKEPAIRIQAIKFLGSCEKEALPHLSYLQEGLVDKVPEIRLWSVLAVGNLGPLAIKYIPQLKQIADDKKEHEPIQKAAEHAIEHILKKDTKDKKDKAK